MNKYPTIKYLKQCLRYENGKVFWLNRPREHFSCDRIWKTWNTRFSGKEAGTERSYVDVKTKHRYIINIKFDNISKLIYRSIIVWALCKNSWPTVEVDHRNRNTLDDKIDNLRMANRTQQRYNSSLSRQNTSGFTGVRFEIRSKRWIVDMRINKKRICRYFKNKEEAIQKRIELMEEHQGEFSVI